MTPKEKALEMIKQGFKCEHHPAQNCNCDERFIKIYSFVKSCFEEQAKEIFEDIKKIGERDCGIVEASCSRIKLDDIEEIKQKYLDIANFKNKADKGKITNKVHKT